MGRWVYITSTDLAATTDTSKELPELLVLLDWGDDEGFIPELKLIVSRTRSDGLSKINEDAPGSSCSTLAFIMNMYSV